MQSRLSPSWDLAHSLAIALVCKQAGPMPQRPFKCSLSYLQVVVVKVTQNCPLNLTK